MLAAVCGLVNLLSWLVGWLVGGPGGNLVGGLLGVSFLASLGGGALQVRVGFHIQQAYWYYIDYYRGELCVVSLLSLLLLSTLATSVAGVFCYSAASLSSTPADLTNFRSFPWSRPLAHAFAFRLIASFVLSVAFIATNKHTLRFGDDVTLCAVILIWTRCERKAFSFASCA